MISRAPRWPAGRPPRAAWLLGLALISAVAPGASTAEADAPPRPAAAGEQWYGSINVTAEGTYPLTDGGTYTSKDSFRLTAPQDAAQGTMNITIDVVVTHPDPFPGQDNCYTKRETWDGVGVVDAAFVVHSNVGGSNYMINVDALAPIQINTSTRYGGVVGGVPCSEGNTTGFGDLAPWIVIHSGRNALPNFRNGSNVTPAPAVGGGGGCQVVSECTDYSVLGGRYPRIRSEWSIAARECTGYSKSYRLGRQDTLFVFNPCQTKSLASRVNFLQEVSGQPKICDYAFVKRLAQACDGYKAVTRIQWGQVDWFLSAATRTDACGVWVVDRADWRRPKVVAANGPRIEVVWINVGDTQLIKTSTGTIRVSCP